eukprot:CAMPEP_0114172634 /NCGR_PEP_ID=MMETSP0043_2-20121206/35383_1 /TAXON_ID=464988 /ORGANISM="Hemiselmis andersenii, Strain CCMP644" /LENGTH=379 /DNA_ID=CAMNT_0001270529 /DNA_START=42 /DNA_END=1178 /DNA_ORIENTATION=-
MPPPQQVGEDTSFRPEHKMLPSPQLEMVTHKTSMRTGELALEPFVPETVEATEWGFDPEAPFEDEEGLPVLPGFEKRMEEIEWKRPSELGLGDVPSWTKLNQAQGEDGEEEEKVHDPVIAKPPRRSTVGQLLEMHCKAMSNPLSQEDHEFLYHVISAVSVSRHINQGTGQDMWDNIYPKNERGQAIYNASGQYIVRLFVLGHWRAVRIDDRLPCVDGECVLPRTNNTAELWPMLIVKALLKVMSVPIPRPPGDEEPEEGAPTRQVLQLPFKERFTFMVTCMTGWHPEACEVEPCEAWSFLGTRMQKGGVCPVVWGTHPQARMKYITSLEDVGDEAEVPPAHWDAQNDSAFYIKPNFSRPEGEVEVQVPKLSWHLPPKPA